MIIYRYETKVEKESFISGEPFCIFKGYVFGDTESEALHRLELTYGAKYILDYKLEEVGCEDTYVLQTSQDDYLCTNLYGDNIQI